MYKSIRNVGVFEGGKAIMHPSGHALTRVLLWPVRIPLKHRMLSSILDYSNLMLSKRLSWLTKFFPNHCINEIIFKSPTVTTTVGRISIPTPQVQKGTLCSPYPRVHSIGSAQKFFSDFHQSNINVLHCPKSCLEG